VDPNQILHGFEKKESLLSLGVHILFGAMLVFFEAEM